MIQINRGRLAILSLVVLSVPAAIFARMGDIDQAAKTQTIDSLFAAMKKSYVFPDKATEAETAIRARLSRGEYAEVKDGTEFAKLLTDHLQAICKDAHLNVKYSEKALPTPKEGGPSPEQIENMKAQQRVMNGGVDQVNRLPGNVGYIRLSGFAPTQFAADPIRAAMDFVANTDALIFDVRQNQGGSPETVRLLCSYLFGETPVHLNDIYYRPTGKTEEFWTLEKVEGKRYLDREVYILTGKGTPSAAEEFAYNLKNLKRATLVGGVTWGGANPGGPVRLNDHFTAFIPIGRSINPITKTNWEGTGVEPDVKVEPSDAMRTAHILALKALLLKAKSPMDKDRLNNALKFAENAKPAGQ